ILIPQLQKEFAVTIKRRSPFIGRRSLWWLSGTVVAVLASLLWVSMDTPADAGRPSAEQRRRPNGERPRPPVKRGQQIFRYDTFGDEAHWTDTLRMHEVIQQAIDPVTALSLGLKVDVEALPEEIVSALVAGEVDLTDPATTLTLLEHDAVVGLVGTVEEVDGARTLTKIGITCALCHSTVDDSLVPGIGRRLDGWANADLDPGAIIAASPAITDEQREVYLSWGPGIYDPRFNIDGINSPIVIPPAYGLKGIAKETFTGDGSVSYWNRYVAVTQMGGQGIFVDPRLGIRVIRFPDRVHSKLPALLAYQLSLETPAPPDDSVDQELADEGELLFHAVGCADCHIPPFYTDINLGILHDAEDVGQDPTYAARTITGKYRTTPLRGLWQHAPYFHDGSAETLLDVVDHYDTHLELQLAPEEKVAIAEFLKTL
ncbi:MAG: hypothetical protein ACF8TS_16605, partial [Maioricimonas sp. JB049]